ncbi:protein kinase, partial [Streptomyces sp. NPDC041003]|uniref:caspase, EACC1-associated type n=1 Tax=Streptomyces sp. NPDC041003 TaxID=3155730 RepID=UPI0033F15EB7
ALWGVEPWLPRAVIVSGKQGEAPIPVAAGPVAGWGLPSRHCTVVADPGHPSDLIDPVQKAAAEATDALLVYYSGHGLLDDELRYSISVTGSRQGEPWTSLPYAWLKSVLIQTRAERRMVILDSCFSGLAHGLMAGEAEALRAQVATAGAVVISSARDDLPALAPIDEPYTAFTGELLQVLTRGIAGGAPEITVDAAYAHVKAALAAKGRPTPDRTGTDTSGGLVIARNPGFRPPSPAAAPRPAPGTHLRALASRLLPPSAQTRSTTRGNDDKTAVGKRYQIISPVGQGGMGTVHLAWDRLLERQVALKVVQVPGLGDPVEREVFWTEVRAVAALNHPNVAAIHDVSEGKAGRFFVMEYVPGIPLSAALAEGTLLPDEAAEAVHDVLSGLEAAHRAGVVHCDVKPGNIMLTPNGTVKILDFGTSHFIANEGQGPLHHEDDDTMVGTVAYMAPEIVRGQLPTVAADIYGAGVVFYELCTGQPPFHTDDLNEMAFRKLHEPVAPPIRLVPELPPSYETIIMRALERSPGERYESAEEMRVEIAAALYGTG